MLQFLSQVKDGVGCDRIQTTSFLNVELYSHIWTIMQLQTKKKKWILKLIYYDNESVLMLTFNFCYPHQILIMNHFCRRNDCS